MSDENRVRDAEPFKHLAHVARMAAQAGVTPAAAGGSLAALLPMLIDHLTPNGQVPHESSLLEQGMNMLNSLKRTGTEG